MIYHKGISGIVFIGEKHKHIDIFITCAITTFIFFVLIDNVQKSILLRYNITIPREFVVWIYRLRQFKIYASMDLGNLTFYI